MSAKSMEEVVGRIKLIEFAEDFDLIVAIANGGVIPAAMLNQRFAVEMALLKLNFRDPKQQPLYDKPILLILLREINFDYRGRKILLVEDRVKTGVTLNYAVELLKGAALIKTLQ